MISCSSRIAAHISANTIGGKKIHLKHKFALLRKGSKKVPNPGR
jgi:hypothetical protein